MVENGDDSRGAEKEVALYAGITSGPAHRRHEDYLHGETGRVVSQSAREGNIMRVVC